MRFVILVCAVFFVASCTLPSPSLSGKACDKKQKCADGFDCDLQTNTCVLPSKPPVSDPGPSTGADNGIDGDDRNIQQDDAWEEVNDVWDGGAEPDTGFDMDFDIPSDAPHGDPSDAPFDESPDESPGPCDDIDDDGYCADSEIDDTDPVVNINRAEGKPLLVHNGDHCPDPPDPPCESWNALVDGDWSTGWHVRTNPSTVAEIDLEAYYVMKIFKYKVDWDSDPTYGTGALIRIYTSNDNENWIQIDERTVSRNEDVRVDLGVPAIGRYVKFNWADAVGAAAGWNGTGNIVELEIYGSIDRLYTRPLIVHSGDVCYPDPSDPNCYDWDDMVDGDFSTDWSMHTNCNEEPWCHTTAVVDLEGNFDLLSFIYRVSWDSRFGTGATIRLRISPDASSWTEADTSDVGQNEVKQVNLAPARSARYVEFDWYGSVGFYWNGWGSVHELVVVSRD